MTRYSPVNPGTISAPIRLAAFRLDDNAVSEKWLQSVDVLIQCGMASLLREIGSVSARLIRSVSEVLWPGNIVLA
jgi:hypothetical protein